MQTGDRININTNQLVYQPSDEWLIPSVTILLHNTTHIEEYVEIYQSKSSEAIYTKGHNIEVSMVAGNWFQNPNEPEKLPLSSLLFSHMWQSHSKGDGKLRFMWSNLTWSDDWQTLPVSPPESAVRLLQNLTPANQGCAFNQSISHNRAGFKGPHIISSTAMS